MHNVCFFDVLARRWRGKAQKDAQPTTTRREEKGKVKVDYIYTMTSMLSSKSFSIFGISSQKATKCFTA